MYIHHHKYGLLKLNFQKLGPLGLAFSSLIPIKEKFALIRCLPILLAHFFNSDKANPLSTLKWDDVTACEFFYPHSPLLVDYIIEPMMSQYFGYGVKDYSLAWLLWVFMNPRIGSNMPWTFKDEGVGKIPAEVQKRFEKNKNCDLLLNTKVTRIIEQNNQIQVDYLSDNIENSKHFDKVIVATPGNFVNHLIQGLDDEIISMAWQETIRALPQFKGKKIYAQILLRNDIGLCRRRPGYLTALAEYLKLPPLNNIYFCGDYLANSTVGCSFRTGVQAAEKII